MSDSEKEQNEGEEAVKSPEDSSEASSAPKEATVDDDDLKLDRKRSDDDDSTDDDDDGIQERWRAMEVRRHQRIAKSLSERGVA